MKFFKLLLSSFLLVGLFVLLNKGFKINDLAVPPLGKILDPMNGLLANAEPNEVEIKKVLKLNGLKEEVEIYWDDRMVPHIFAKNTRDAFYAQGYVTASMRLWQMDFQTRAAAGRLSEVLYTTLGEGVLKFDRLQRRNGMLASARKSAAIMMEDPETALVVQAYTDGINAYIDRLNYRSYPIEYKILNYKPEKWSPLKSALLLKYMAQMLTDDDLDLGIINAYKLFDKEDIDFLFKEFPDGTSNPIIPSGTKFNFAKNTVADSSGSDTNLVAIKGLIPEIENVNYFRGVGSNNWAISGSKSATGKPILCNDPHLKLNLPSIWFEIQIVTPQFNVYGASLPGAPCVISGFNSNIAWGVTNGTRNVRDWYAIEWKDDSKTEYNFQGEWLKTEFEYDTIKIKGKPDFIDRYLVTKMGRVVYEDSLMSQGIGSDLALFWTAYLPANELKTFVQLNRAENHDDYINALQYFGCPAQNFVFAASNGDIAIKQQGYHLKYPKNYGYGVRKDFISEVIPSDENPHILNPDRGFVSSANQHPTDTLYPYYYNGIFEEFRNVRINDLLSKNNGITIDFMKSLQGDNLNQIAMKFLPVFLKYGEQEFANHPEWLKLLKDWNYFNDAEQIAPSIFEAWFVSFKELVYDEWEGFKGEKADPGNLSLYNLLMSRFRADIFDIKATPEKEDAFQLIAMSASNAIKILEEKQKSEGGLEWYKYKGTSVQHILGIKPFSRYQIKIGGNYSIVNACSDRWGSSWKMIVSFEEDGVNALGIYPGGQSGNPGSSYYDNMINDWASGHYYKLNYFKNSEEAAVGTHFQKLIN